MNDQTADVDRIPLTRSVHYAVRGMPEVPNQYGPGVLAPSEITLTYRDGSDSQLGRVHAYVAGRIWVDGKELPLLPGGLYGQHYFDGLDGWPEWLAEEARLHDPAAATPAGPATTDWIDGHPQLEAIATAVWEQCGRSDSGMCVEDDPRNIAVAALAAVLPAPARQAAVLLEAADELGRMDYDTDSNDYGYDTYRDAWNGGVMDGAERLRRLAGEAQQDERCTRCRHPKRDHDGRADHRAKYSPLVAGEPWCHACNAECDYAREAQQDRECSASISGNCLREAQSETACNTEDGECVHGGQPAREAQQDPTQDGTAPRPATVAWDFGGEYEPGKWHGIGNTYRNHDQALAYLDRRAETDKEHRRIRMVRATATYTVEAERTPAAVARPGQPDTDDKAVDDRG